VKEKKRCVNFVCIEQRTLVYVEVFTVPRVAFGHRNLAVRVAPITFSPVTGVVADAGMRNGCCKNIGLRLQILGHEATVRGADAAYALRVYIGMSNKKGFR